MIKVFAQPVRDLHAQNLPQLLAILQKGCVGDPLLESAMLDEMTLLHGAQSITRCMQTL